MEAQRYGGEPLHQRLQVAAPAEAQGGRALAQRGQVETSAGRAHPDAGHVHEGVAHRHGALGVDLRLGAVLVHLAHLGGAELRDVPVHRVAERERSGLVQAEQRHAGDGLGHGVQAPDGVVGDLDLVLPVGEAEGGGVGHLTPPGHHHLAAGDLARLDVAGAEVVVDPGQAVGVEPGGVRVELEGHGRRVTRSKSACRRI
jgi:hypothetical protein